MTNQVRKTRRRRITIEQLQNARFDAREKYRTTGDLKVRDDYQRIDAWIALKRGFDPVCLPFVK